MTNRQEIEAINIKLPKLSTEVIPVEHYLNTFHNSHSRLNPENNFSDFNDFKHYTIAHNVAISSNSDDTSGNQDKYKPKRTLTQEDLNNNKSKNGGKLLRAHSDLHDEPINRNPFDPNQVFEINFTEAQIKAFRKNRIAGSYARSDRDSTTTASNSESNDEYSSQSHSDTSQNRIFIAGSLHEGYFTINQVPRSHQSTGGPIYRRERLDSLSVASSLQSPEFYTENSPLRFGSSGDESDGQGLHFAPNESFSIDYTSATISTVIEETEEAEEVERAEGAEESEESDVEESSELSIVEK